MLFFVKIVVRAGLRKRGDRLEALLRSATQQRMQKFLIGRQVINIEIVDGKERGLGHEPNFTSPAET